MTISVKKFGRNFVGYLISARRLLAVLGVTFFLLWMLLWWAEGPSSASPRVENLGAWESLYLAAVSALTIGYGDLAPVTVFGRITVVLLGMLGMTYTGIVVAAAIAALPNAEA